MNKTIVIVLLGGALTGCANGAIAELGYSRCAGYEEYKEDRAEYSRAKMKQQDILFAYRRASLTAVSTENNGVTTTVLVNPLEEEREAIARKKAFYRAKMKEFEKTCTLYSW